MSVLFSVLCTHPGWGFRSHIVYLLAPDSIFLFFNQKFSFFFSSGAKAYSSFQQFHVFGSKINCISLFFSFFSFFVLLFRWLLVIFPCLFEIIPAPPVVLLLSRPVFMVGNGFRSTQENELRRKKRRTWRMEGNGSGSRWRSWLLFWLAMLCHHYHYCFFFINIYRIDRILL